MLALKVLVLVFFLLPKCLGRALGRNQAPYGADLGLRQRVW